MKDLGQAPDVTVIIPTAGYRDRSDSLFRAIESVLSQESVDARVLVVLNGTSYCLEVRARLEHDRRISLHYVPLGSLPNAVYEGRKCVSSRYFAFLDDDDEYLPGALVERISAMRVGADVVASNGYRVSASGNRNLIFTAFSENEAAPLLGLAKGNWLASCGGLYRTASVCENYFSDIPKYFEWTWLAIRLSLDKKIVFLDMPTFVVNDTSGSLSKTDAYDLEEFDFIYRVMRELPVPEDFKRSLKKKLAGKYIGFANRYLSNGQRLKALRYYFRCIGVGREGLPYVPWPRKLLMSYRR